MKSNTKRYLEGRFSDYYRQAEVSLPPQANEREFAFIPWVDTEETIMARHRSMLDLGDIGEFLTEKHPRHMYTSAGKYRHPSAENSMGNKEWKGADLIFDLDADHFPDINPRETSKKQMLEKCKEKTINLVNILKKDFAFDDISVAFSGNRGYHVHVRDENIQQLDGKAREEIADYVSMNNIDLNKFIVEKEENGVIHRRIRNKGGWGRRITNELVNHLRTLAENNSTKELKNTLTNYQGIGEKKADHLAKDPETKITKLNDGNAEIGKGDTVRRLFIQYGNKIKDDISVPIDAPVTTDTHRLIRLPNSLHGATALIVEPVPIDELSDYDPLKSAVPSRFIGRKIKIESHEENTITLNGKRHEIEQGQVEVEEYVGLYLMAQNKAERIVEI